MKRSQNNIDKIESFSTIVVNIGTILSWLFTIFTAFVLTSQSQPISLPGVLELNASYKLLFLTSIFLGYIQLLKRSWGNQKRTAKDIEGSFGSYLYGSVIKFQRPLVIIGFLIILSIFLIVVFTEVIGLAVTMIVVGLFLVMMLALTWKGTTEKLTRLYDDEFRKRWLKRVKKQLYQNGFTHTGDFIKLSAEIEEINWAIKLYFDYYEFEQDLSFNQQYIKDGLESYEICEIRFSHVASHINDE